MSRTFIALAVLGGAALPTLALPTLALAQTVAPDVVITASRLPEPLAAAPGAYVVDHDQIVERGAVFAVDILATVPGVNIFETGFGGISSLSLRGAPSDKTVVLIDGVPVNDPSQPEGSFDFSSLDLASTQRIEVLNGPQSALWGSDAVGGVVSITTIEPNGLRLAGEAGSLDTYREIGSFGVSTSGYAAGISYSGFRSAGVPNADEKFGNTQPDGFNDTTINLNGRYDPTDRVSLDARVRYVHSAEEYDDFFSDPSFVEDPNASTVSDSESGYVRARIKNVLGFDQEVRVDLMDIARSYFGEFPFSARGDQEALRWTATRQTQAWSLQLGLEDKRAAENTGSGQVSRNDAGAFAIGRWTPDDRLSLTASVRQDQYEGFTGQTTARGAAAYSLGWGFSLLGSVGQGYKAPSVYEITYPCLECTVVGPPKLKAEQALGEDAGLAWRAPNDVVQGRVTVFGLSLQNEIQYVFPIGYENLSDARDAGLEFEGQARLGHGFSLRGAFTYIEGVDGTGPAQLVRIPRNSGSGSLTWAGQAWGRGAGAEIGFRGQDQAQDFYGEVRPYMIAYVNAHYDLTPHLSLTGRIENAGNTHYEQAYGYGEPGRMVLVGLSWK